MPQQICALTPMNDGQAETAYIQARAEAPIPADLRQQVIERAGDWCEYCQAPLTIVVEMEIDHIVPESAGGPTELDNLCVTCVGCNGFKLAFQEAEDPETGEVVSLFNPRQQVWIDHFAWSDDGTEMIGLSSTHIPH